VRTLARRPEAEDLERRYPGVLVWFGQATGSWWCVPPVTWRTPPIFEARSPEQLDLMIRSALGWR